MELKTIFKKLSAQAEREEGHFIYLNENFSDEDFNTSEENVEVRESDSQVFVHEARPYEGVKALLITFQK